jgi:hypothetical protein
MQHQAELFALLYSTARVPLKKELFSMRVETLRKQPCYYALTAGVAKLQCIVHSLQPGKSSDTAIHVCTTILRKGFLLDNTRN